METAANSPPPPPLIKWLEGISKPPKQCCIDSIPDPTAKPHGERWSCKKCKRGWKIEVDNDDVTENALAAEHYWVPGLVADEDDESPPEPKVTSDEEKADALIALLGHEKSLVKLDDFQCAAILRGDDADYQRMRRLRALVLAKKPKATRAGRHATGSRSSRTGR